MKHGSIRHIAFCVFWIFPIYMWGQVTFPLKYKVGEELKSCTLTATLTLSPGNKNLKGKNIFISLTEAEYANANIKIHNIKLGGCPAESDFRIRLRGQAIDPLDLPVKKLRNDPSILSEGVTFKLTTHGKKGSISIYSNDLPKTEIRKVNLSTIIFIKPEKKPPVPTTTPKPKKPSAQKDKTKKPPVVTPTPKKEESKPEEVAKKDSIPSVSGDGVTEPTSAEEVPSDTTNSGLAIAETSFLEKFTKTPSYQFAAGIGFFILLALAIVLIRKSRPKPQIPSKVPSKEHEVQVVSGPEKAAPVATADIENPSTSDQTNMEESEKKKPEGEEVTKKTTSSGITITQTVKSTDAENVKTENEAITELGIHTVDMRELWENPAVEKMILSKNFVSTLDLFLRSENNNLQDDEITEIGGLILGKASKLIGQKAYTVYCEVFLPSKEETRTVTRVEMGPSVWMALDDALQQHPDLQAVGWFHTHPGHGLFLSGPDLNIQKTFFKKPFQVAMEIDSKTPNYDTAFFCWNADKTDVYNARHRKASRWFHWTEIEKKLRT